MYHTHQPLNCMLIHVSTTLSMEKTRTGSGSNVPGERRSEIQTFFDLLTSFCFSPIPIDNDQFVQHLTLPRGPPIRVLFTRIFQCGLEHLPGHAPAVALLRELEDIVFLSRARERDNVSCRAELAREIMHDRAHIRAAR